MLKGPKVFIEFENSYIMGTPTETKVVDRSCNSLFLLVSETGTAKISFLKTLFEGTTNRFSPSFRDGSKSLASEIFLTSFSFETSTWTTWKKKLGIY